MIGMEYRLEPLFCARIAMEKLPEVIGVTPEGLRLNFYFRGGEIDGPRFRGRVRAVGGDSFLVRRDGVATIDMRTTFESHDDVLVAAHHTGIVDLGERGFDDALARKLPSKMSARISATYLTGGADYQWMNRVLCLGILEVDRDEFSLAYDIYAVG